MIRISNISLPVDGDLEQLRKKAAKILGIRPSQLERMTLARQSIDARNKSQLHYVYTVDVTVKHEEQVVRYASGKNVSLYERTEYVFPEVKRHSSLMPVVVGMGPAGLFAALYLARAGVPCIVLERGQDVDTRSADVEHFWESGTLTPSSNVQFGEGGAGTFSDGKLTTGTHDPRISTVFESLVEAGAPEDIRYSHKPHVGTDVLREVVRNIRCELLKLGCEVRFGHRLTSIEHSGGTVTGIEVTTKDSVYRMECDALILAPGHSARDTFRMLKNLGVPMEQKPFAVGVRIEHEQSVVSQRQYGPEWEKLPPSDYKLACHLPNGRSAFTFCVCPGGQVVAAASDMEQVVTNGMSLRARDGKNINGGFLVGVGPQDFPGEDVLAGVLFQEQWERKAWEVGGKSCCAPAQRVEDFLLDRPSEGAGSIFPTYRPGVAWGKVSEALPDVVSETLRGALPVMDRKLKGFACGDAVLTGIESRSSSSVRILRDEHFQSALRGLYPCGEGAGYAGGIVSAAVDGIRVAEAVAEGQL